MSAGGPYKGNGAGASRGPKGGNKHTTLSPAYETRQLKIAYGLQFHPDESLDCTPQKYLDDHLELSASLEKISASEYLNHKQGVRYTIEETISKQKFMEWLQTPGLHVIYMGHARYGRGPCFGAHGLNPNDRSHLQPGEDWELGTDADSGIFRMGYPFLGVPVSELIDHGYTADAMKESEGRPARSDCDPYLRHYLTSLRPMAPNEMRDKLAAQFRDYQDGDRYWTYKTNEGICIIHRAGWRDTLSKSSDLGTLQDPKNPKKTKMTCRVFTHLGCTSWVHNYAVVRWIANWKQSGNERYAHWTDNYSYKPHAIGPWVHAVISYNQHNAFKSWGPSLKWALKRANQAIRRAGANYQLK
ncbi:MAG TPA: hypothetical protein VMH28_11595 [Candidatus Acidoferrales bacterium]|nr:hypothetical protein [Candidatus Acidoferrales bacterium]